MPFKRFGAVLLVLGAALLRTAGADEIAVIPKPANMVVLPGVFVVTPSVIVITDGSAGAAAAGKALAGLFTRSGGFTLPLRPLASRAARRILITSRGSDKSLGPEGYELRVTVDAVELRAPGSAGMFYGVQTIRQLLPAAIDSDQRVPNAKWTIPCVRITDKPRFAWRGLLIDSSRTFEPMSYLKRCIDMLALYKMNVFHWHLTDDQGWRMEVSSLPRLTSVGSRFDERYNEFGGYYTQAEIRDFVAYAAARHVTVVPEIEMPGHAAAALAAYPELSCAGEAPVIFPFQAALVPGLQPFNFCPGNEQTFRVLGSVLGELVKLFPSRYVHIGGDEVVKDRWKSCPKCQARMKSEHLANEGELQSYFVKRIEKILASKGRRLIGWDEILEGGLPPKAAVMSWRGTSGGLAAIRAGHDVVFSPYSHLYFDYPNESYTTANVYSFEPMPDGLSGDEAKHVLGAQGNMWTHIARSEDAIDRQVFPRLIALSEVVWSPREARSFADFRNRAQAHLARLDVLHVKHAAL